MGKKKLLAVAVCAATIMGVSGNAAYAQGQFEQGPEHANSICSFSGLNDEPDLAGPEGGRVQSYGQIVRQGGKAYVPSPGLLCNAHLFPYPEAFPEEE